MHLKISSKCLLQASCVLSFTLCIAAVSIPHTTCETKHNNNRCVPEYQCSDMRHLKNKLERMRPRRAAPVSACLDKVRCNHDAKHEHYCCDIMFIEASAGYESSLDSNKVKQLQLEDYATTADNYPWMVQLQYDSKTPSSFKCDGALITSRYMLTAAHCTSPTSGLIGANLYAQSGKRLHIDIDSEDIIRHPAYNEAQNIYDIALIRLRRNDLEGIKPIMLPLTAPTYEYDHTFHITTWQNSHPTKLAPQKVAIEYSRNNDCPDGSSKKVTSAAAYNIGAAIFAQNGHFSQLHGITSDGVATNLLPVMPWIISQL